MLLRRAAIRCAPFFCLWLAALSFLLNCGGSSQNSVQNSVQNSIAVLAGYPTSSVAGHFGMALKPVGPVPGSVYSGYTITPALPAGLSLDPATGILSGTPLAVAAMANYQITGTGPGGQATTTLSLAVVPVPIFAQEDVFYSDIGLLASVPAMPGFTCQWSIQNLDASATVTSGATGNVLTYATGPTQGHYILIVRIQDSGGHACTTQRTLRVVGNCFLKDIHTLAQRAAYTATPLLDGTVLFAGGIGNLGPAFAFCEIFDPATATWAVCGSMAGARFYHSATRLADGCVLVVGGCDSAQNPTTGVELFTPATGLWTRVQDLPAPRFQHSAILLPDGDVLVAGGLGLPVGGLPTANSDTYRFHPATGTWTTVGHLTGARKAFSTTLLLNGKVLAVGGWVLTSRRNDAALFDPAKNVWTPVTNLMRSGREGHTANLLGNGKVLVQGGTDVITGPELFDPGSGTWSLAGTMAEPCRMMSGSALLADGSVLVAGGEGGISASAELYDPATNSWSPAGTLNFATRTNMTLVPLHDGKVLMAGGASVYSYSYSNPYLYNPAAATWTALGAEGLDRFLHTATLLADGRVILTGGIESFGHGGSQASALLYDASANQPWSRPADMSKPRHGQIATLLPSGQVLVAAGNGNGYYLSSSELFDPLAATWVSASDVPSYAGENSGVSVLPSGTVVMTGGKSYTGSLATTYLYDPVLAGWSLAGALGTARYGHSSNILGDGRVLVAGGSNFQTFEGGVLGSTEVFEPITGQWSSGASLATPREWHTATSLRDGSVLVAGGDTGGAVLASTERYDPLQGIWSAAPNMLEARTYHSATLLPDGTILVVGGMGGSGTVLGSAERYDPATRTWTRAGVLMAPRDSQTATLLPNGKVLIAGGDLGYIPEFWKP